MSTAQAMQARADAADPRLEVHRERLHVRRPGGGDEPEEHEHEQLAEAVVAVGMPPARVEPGRDHGHRADREQPPLLGHDHEREAGERRDREEAEADREHLPRLRRPRSREPGRARPGARRCRAPRRSSRWRSSPRSAARARRRARAARGPDATGRRRWPRRPLPCRARPGRSPAAGCAAARRPPSRPRSPGPGARRATTPWPGCRIGRTCRGSGCRRGSCAGVSGVPHGHASSRGSDVDHAVSARP